MWRPSPIITHTHVVVSVWLLSRLIVCTSVGTMTPGSATCMGSASGGGYGACCDSDSQCGDGLFCQSQFRYCTLPCQQAVDCPVSPLYGQQLCLSNYSVPAQCVAPASYADAVGVDLGGGGRRTTSSDRRLQTAVSESYFCDASTAFGWSFAAYCSVRPLVKRACWSGCSLCRWYCQLVMIGKRASHVERRVEAE